MSQTEASGEDYQLGVALISVLVSIAFSVGFGVYQISKAWWLGILLAVIAPVTLALAIKVGGQDGVIPKMGQWVLR